MSSNLELQEPKLDRNALVVRHNHLIESRHRLSLVERRFMLWIISQIGKNDEDLEVYSISVKEWIEFAGLKNNPKIYNDIYNMSRRLIERSVDIKQKDGSFELFPWFHKIKYHAGDGNLTVQMHPDLKPYLLELKSHFTTLTLEYALLLQSSYAGRIYDLLKQYESIGDRTIDILEFRRMLRIDNIYTQFSHLKDRVLDVAKKEINSKTDISFDWKPIKEGRKYSKIEFTIWSEPPTVNLDNNREESEPRAKRVLNCLLQRNIEESLARSLVNTHDDERIMWHVREFDRKILSKEIKGTGWLIKGIETDYRPKQKTLFDEKELKKKEKEHRKKKEQNKREEAIKKAKLDYEKFYANHINEARDNLTPEARNVIDTTFLKLWDDEKDDVFGVAKNFREKELASRYTALRYAESLLIFYPDLFVDPKKWAKKQKLAKYIIDAISKT